MNMGFIMRNKIILFVLAIVISTFSFTIVQYLNKDHSKNHLAENTTEKNTAIKNKYVCPMHSHIVSHEAGSCPICGMDLVLNKSAVSSPHNHTKSHSTKTIKPSSEYTAVTVSPSVTHNLGIRTAIVERGNLTHDIETIGKITRVDPMARSRVTSPINGTLVKIINKYQGDKIKRDEFLFSVASDELFNMEKAFQQAVNEGDIATATAMIPKLVSMGLSTEQIAQLQNGATPDLTANILAKEDGYIFTRRGKPGDPVTSAFTVFNLGGNYQVIEVTVEIFERQWDLVKEGQSATMQLRNLPGKIFHGTVERVDEPVGYTTRALETRIKFKTDYEGLTQSTFARVIISGKSTLDVITVPRDAVIRTAQGNRVVKLKDNGQYQPVVVKIGDESDGKVEITAGIKEGDKVVVSGQFLIDSESNLLSDLNRMSSPEETKTPSVSLKSDSSITSNIKTR